MYRDEEGFLHASPNVFNSENAVEFTVLEYFLGTEHDADDVVLKYLTYCDTEKVDTKYKLSHDNLTACYAYFSMRAGDDEIGLLNISDKRKQMLILLRRARHMLNSYHPREWAFYNICEQRFTVVEGFLISVIMVIGCARKWKRRTYGNGNKVVLPYTDSKLLAWLRLCVMEDYRLTTRVCSFFVRRNFGSWRAVFGIYFKKEHPLNGFLSMEYEL